MFKRRAEPTQSPGPPNGLLNLVIDVARAVVEAEEAYRRALGRLGDSDALEDPPFEALRQLAMTERTVVLLTEELRDALRDELLPFAAVRALRPLRWAMLALTAESVDRRDLLTPDQLDAVLGREGVRDWADMILRESGVAAT